MTQTEWTLAFSDTDRSIADENVDGYRVSTVWLGMNHEWRDGHPPLIFETMVFGGEPWDGYMLRYTTEAQAVAGHDQLVARIREGEQP